MASIPDFRGVPLLLPLADSSEQQVLDGAVKPDEEAVDVDETQAQNRTQPRMKWVYNSDHTDPVNFGYMFLVPDDNPEDPDSPPTENQKKPVVSKETGKAAAVPAPSSFTSGARKSSITNLTSQISSQPIPDFVSEGSYLSNVYSTGVKVSTPHPLTSSEYSVQNPHSGQLHSPPHSDSSGSSHHHYPRSNSAHSVTSPQHLVYRPSPELSPPTLPPDNLVLDEGWSWQPPIDQNLEHHQLPNQWGILFRDTTTSTHPSFSNTTPSAPAPAPVLIHAPSLSKKRQRSPSPFQDASSSGISFPLLKAFPKRQRPINADLTFNRGVPATPLICSKCQIYQVARFTPQQTRDLLNRQKETQGPAVCNLCLQEFNMYKWPSANQSRMENLESLVLFLLPAHMEDSLLNSPGFIPRRPSWRGFFLEKPHLQYDFDALAPQDQISTSVQRARSTMLWGDDYGTLANITRDYQSSLPQPNVSIEAASTCLSAVCDLYNCFITSPTRPPTCSVNELIANVRTVRITLRNAFQQLEFLALAPSEKRSRKDWFPTFISAVMLTMAAITYIDILGSCPSPYKEQIWGVDWGEKVKRMRHGGYGMLINVLRQNTNGVNPLKLECWEEEASPFIISTPKSYSQGKKSPDAEPRNRRESIKGQWGIGTRAERERNVLLGRQSPAAMEGVLAVKKWQQRYKEDLILGQDMFTKEMYAQAMMRPVASLWKVFEMTDTG